MSNDPAPGWVESGNLEMKVAKMKPGIGRVICALRKERGLRQKELAELSGLKQPNLSRIEAGTVQPRKSTLERLSRALGVEYSELISDTLHNQLEAKWGELMFPKRGSNGPALGRIPVFKTDAGYQLKADKDGRPTGEIAEMLNFPGLPADAFGVRVFGDSMQAEHGNESFLHGDTVIFSEGDAFPGSFAFIRFRDGFTFKQVFFDETGRVRLVPLNQHYDPMILDRHEVQRIWPLRRLIRNF